MQRKIVKYTAKWCVPCRALEPILETAEKKGLIVERVDVDEHPEAVETENIMSIPTVDLFADNQRAGRLVGTAPDTFDRIKQFIGAAT